LRHTLEAKLKISVAMKGKPRSKPSKETIAKRVASTRSRRASVGYVDPRIGREMSQETRMKLSSARTGKRHTLEARVKISNARRGTQGHKQSSETIEKRMASIRATMSAPGYLDPRIGRKLSSDHIQKAVAAKRLKRASKEEAKS
jgi:hypothetical protein